VSDAARPLKALWTVRLLRRDLPKTVETTAPIAVAFTA